MIETNYDNLLPSKVLGFQLDCLNTNERESSGTSLIALKFEGGVVIGADSRVTQGQIVSSRTGRKIGMVHYRIAVASSGKMSDILALSQILKSSLSQNSQELNSPGGTFQPQAQIPANLPTVKSAAHIHKSMVFNYKGRLSASCIIAGWDPKRGAQIYAVPKGGVMHERSYTADGSGSIFMLSYLDENYSTTMTKEECVEMAKKALKMAIKRDASSGGLIDIVTILPDGVEQKRYDANDYDYTP